MVVCIEDLDGGFFMKKKLNVWIWMCIDICIVIRYYFVFKIFKDILKMFFYILYRVIKILVNE